MRRSNLCLIAIVVAAPHLAFAGDGCPPAEDVTFSPRTRRRDERIAFV
jgi:hypothetical protein